MGTAFPTKLHGPPSVPLALKGYESPAAERLSPTPVGLKPEIYYEARRRLAAAPGAQKLSTVRLRRVSGECPVRLR